MPNPLSISALRRTVQRSEEELPYGGDQLDAETSETTQNHFIRVNEDDTTDGRYAATRMEFNPATSTFTAKEACWLFTLWTDSLYRDSIYESRVVGIHTDGLFIYVTIPREFEGALLLHPYPNIASGDCVLLNWCELVYDTDDFLVAGSNYQGFNSSKAGVYSVTAGIMFRATAGPGSTPWVRLQIGVSECDTGLATQMIPVLPGQECGGTVTFITNRLGPWYVNVDNLSTSAILFPPTSQAGIDGNFFSVKRIHHVANYPFAVHASTDPSCEGGTGGSSPPPGFNTVHFTIAGVANGICDDCASINQSYVLDHVSGTYYADTGLGTICDPELGTETQLAAYIYFDEGLSQWVLVIQATDGTEEFGQILAFYENLTGVGANWNGSAMTMTKDAGYDWGACTSWPATISVTGV